MTSKDYEEHCKRCNNLVKTCQTCYFFRPITFDHEDEYYEDDELGMFTLWVWKGYCLNDSMPNDFPALYHKTKSNRKCNWYASKKEYELLAKKFKDKTLNQEEYMRELANIRNELKKEQREREVSRKK